MGCCITLHDGIPSKKDIKRLKNEVPKQEVGRLSYKELTLSRANKSVRIFDHVVDRLSKVTTKFRIIRKSWLSLQNNSSLWFRQIWASRSF